MFNYSSQMYEKLTDKISEAIIVRAANCPSQCTGCICACNRKNLDLVWRF